jgi:hypothetical protein
MDSSLLKPIPTQPGATQLENAGTGGQLGEAAKNNPYAVESSLYGTIAATDTQPTLSVENRIERLEAFARHLDWRAWDNFPEPTPADLP